MKLVINEGDSQYSLNENAYNYLGLNWQNLVVAPLERAIPGGSKEITPLGFYCSEFERRNNKDLVRMVETLGPNCGGPGVYLKVVEIPDFSRWRIEFDDTGHELLIWK